MKPNHETEVTAPEILSIPLSWPKPLRGLERIWRNLSGQERAFQMGLEKGVRSASTTACHRIGNSLSPLVYSTEQLAKMPFIKLDPEANEYVETIVIAARRVTGDIDSLGRVRKVVFEDPRFDILDLEAGSKSQPK